ncbi:MAG: CPBP family intramembrane metalloprotease [Lachnospiraceae bacterium]|nr:CPBP family intramembrane metalloprotease [Lachnospiraceae bacterium]
MEGANRKANGFFLIIVILNITASILLSVLDSGGVKVGTEMALVITQLLVLVPSLLFLLIHRCDINEWVPFRKLRVWTVFLIILFSFLIMPFISLINLFSQLFTDNVVTTAMASEFSGVSPVLLVTIVAFVGPFCEEFAFRGILFGGLKKTGYVLAAAVVSSFFFGLMHLNLNQMSYAIVMGVIFCLLVEATGSIWASVISHAVINGFNIVSLMVIEKVYSEMGEDISSLASQASDMDEKFSMMGALIGVSAIALLFAVGAYIGIYELEGRRKNVAALFFAPDREEGDRRLVTPAGAVAIVICIFVIFFLGRFLAMLDSFGIIK